MTRPTIDDLEMLNTFELMKLLYTEVSKDSVDAQFIQDLLIVGCSIDARTSGGNTPLHLMAILGRLETVQFLISKGADINARDIDGRTALHHAAIHRKFKVLEYLISGGAQVDIMDKYGYTAWGAAGTIIRNAYPELEPK